MKSVAIQDVMSQLPNAELEATLNAFVEPITRRLPDARYRQSVPTAILGILGSHSPVIGAMAQGGKTDSRSVWAQAKRFYRLLGSDRLNHRDFFDGLNEIGQRLVAEEGPARVVIAIDPVNFEKPYAKKLEGVCTVRKSTPPDREGHARLTSGYPAITATVVNTQVPVVCYADWFSYTTDDFYGEKEEILRAILASQRTFLGRKRRFVADSGLDDDAIYEWMGRLGETFVIRVKHFHRIVEAPLESENGEGEEWTSTSVGAVSRSVTFGPSFRVMFRHAGRQRLARIQLGVALLRLPDTKQRLWLVAAREVSSTGTEIGRILLVTNTPIREMTDLQSIYEDWRLRSRIEHVYRFDQEQGVDVEDIRVRTLERMRRLFALVIVAVMFVFYLGETWPPKAILWLRQLGGKLGQSSDRDGAYRLLRGLTALILTRMTLAFLDQHRFPWDAFSSKKLPLDRYPSYG
jgi:hypothetical protein